jgi:hypothetical protein
LSYIKTLPMGLMQASILVWHLPELLKLVIQPIWITELGSELFFYLWK